MNYIILIMTLNSHQTFVRVHMYIKHLIFLCHLQHLIISFFYQSLRLSAHISHTLSFKRNACYWLRKKSVGNYTIYTIHSKHKIFICWKNCLFRATACPRQDWRFKNTVLKWMCHEIFHLSILLRNRTNLSPWKHMNILAENCSDPEPDPRIRQR